MSDIANIPEPDVEFDRNKFVAVVHYIIARCSDDPDALGKTKLHKALYYADMLAYLESGVALTGVEYIKQPYGPTARHLGWALKQLSQSGQIEIRKRAYFGLGKFDFSSRQSAASNLLSESDRMLLDTVVDLVCGYSAKQISEISHTTPWEAVEFGERIPYSTAFFLVPQQLPSLRDIEWATSVADDAVAAGVSGGRRH